MKLTKKEIKYIDNYLIKSKVKYWDVRVELLDHIASAVEEKIEKDLLENILTLDLADNTNNFVFKQLKPIAKKLGWTKNKTKGVVGSLIKKDIMYAEDADFLGFDGNIFYFSMPVSSDDFEEYELINTVEKMEKYLTEREVA